MVTSYVFRGATFALLLAIVTSVDAQFNSIVGGGSFAKDCYQASQIASNTGFSSRQDIEICDKAIFYGDLNTRDAVATYVNRGIIKVALDDFKGGVEDYERAMKLQSVGTAEAYLNRGNIWIMAKQYDRAVTDYQTALDLGVNKTHIAEINLGLAHEYLGDDLQAKEHYEKALVAVPEWPIALEKLDRVNMKIASVE